ncbi:MAG: glycosyltransferase family 87 protein [Chloroflexales bacterium]
MFLRTATPAPARAHLGGMLGCLVLTLILGCLAFQVAPPLYLEASPYDQNFLSGADEIEQIAGVPGRWTLGAAELRLPSLGVRPAILSLGLLNSRPSTMPDPSIDFAIGGQHLAAMALAHSGGQARRFMLLLPPTLGSWADIHINSDTISLADDPRPLGVVFQAARLEATAGGLRLPPPLSLIALAGLALLSYGALRGAGLGARATIGLVILITAGLAAEIALRPLETLPFLGRLSALAAIACATIWLARVIAPPQASAGRLVVRRADLPIYLGLAWWTMPLYQIVLTLDGVRNGAPNPVTIAIGAATALAALAALALRDVAARRGWAYRQVLIAVLVGGSLAHSAFLIGFAFTRSGPDFWIHFRAIRGFVRDGLPLYDLAGIQANHFGFSYKWPPLYAAILRPFALLDGTSVLLGQRILNTLLLGTTAVLLLRRAPSWPIAAGILMLFNFRPATDTIAFGQVDVALLFVAALVLLAALRGRDSLAGALIAFFALIKLYPALLFGFFLAQRRWRVIGGAILAGLACTALTVATFGWATHRIFIAQVMPIIGGSGSSSPWIENQTFSGFFSRFFAPKITAEPFGTPLITLATYAFFGLSLLLAFALAAPGARTDPDGGRWASWKSAAPLQYSLFLLLTVLAVPAAWMHYETVIILAFAAVLLHGDAPLPLGSAAALAAAYALIAYGNQSSFGGVSLSRGLMLLGYSFKFYGLMLMLGIISTEIWRDLAAQRVAAPTRSIAAPAYPHPDRPR